MINAAEPVDEAAIINFYKTFRPFGLSSGVVLPTYGLAEHTVFVCSGGTHVLKLNKKDFDNQIIDILEVSLLGESGVVISGKYMNEIQDKDSDITNIRGRGGYMQVDNEQSIVGCGYPGRGDGVELLIVDAESRTDLGEDKVTFHFHP